MSGDILSVRDVNKYFGRNHVLRGVTLSLAQGEIFGFIGPNGAGKTTLIRIILGLIRADRGQVAINGFDIQKQFKQAIRPVGAVVETPKFYPYLSARQNLAQIIHIHPEVPKTKIGEVLDMVGLKARANDRVDTYSLGMKQRLGLARVLINDPAIVFLDEPLNGLDPQGITAFRELIKRLQREKKMTFFITSHLLYEVEQICDSIALLKKGEIVQRGELRQLLSSATETVDLYIKDKSIAVKHLSSVPIIRSIEQLPDRIRVTIEKNKSAELIRLLVAEQIDLHYIVPRSDSLEEFFMRTTKGEDNHARTYQE